MPFLSPRRTHPTLYRSLQPHTDFCQTPTGASSIYLPVSLFPHPDQMRACLNPVSCTQGRLGAMWVQVGQSAWGRGACIQATLRACGDSGGEALTSCCGDGSHRRRCSSSGRSDCSAGTRAETAEHAQLAAGPGAPARYPSSGPSRLNPCPAAPRPQAPALPPQGLHSDSVSPPEGKSRGHRRQEDAGGRSASGQ